jgi:hypothetical protein
MSRYTHLVIIFREQQPTVTGFYNRADAEAFYESAGAQWSATFLVEILKGPLA